MSASTHTLARWLRPDGADPLQQEFDWDPTWGFFMRMREFVTAVLRQPPRPDVREAREHRARPTLPFDLYLALGQTSIRLFNAGAVDEFSFYQRSGVGAHHDVEFLTRLERTDRGSERYQPFGVIRINRGRPLPTLSSLEDYGLSTLPNAKELAVRPFGAYDPAIGDAKAGRNRVAAPRERKVFARVGLRRFYTGDVLEILRRELSDAQKIAWLEQAFSERLRLGEIVHRYYTSSSKSVYLVRDHWAQGKRLYKAETSAAAKRLCLRSGAFRRSRAA